MNMNVKLIIPNAQNCKQFITLILEFNMNLTRATLCVQ